jgi:hypothetical protein
MAKPFWESIALLLIGAVVTFLASWFWFAKTGRRANGVERRQAEQKLKDRVTELESKIALVQQAVVPISTAFQAILIKELTHLHAPELDALMLKLGPPFTLTLEEQERLTVLLTERARDMGDSIPQSEREAAMMLPFIIKRVRAENGLDVNALQLAVVALPRRPRKARKEK